MQVHGSGQEERDLDEDARMLLAVYLEEGAQLAAGKADCEAAAARAALASLCALLPDLEGVLLGAAATDVELGAAADILTTLSSLVGLWQRESEVSTGHNGSHGLCSSTHKPARRLATYCTVQRMIAAVWVAADCVAVLHTNQAYDRFGS